MEGPIAPISGTNTVVNHHLKWANKLGGIKWDFFLTWWVPVRVKQSLSFMLSGFGSQPQLRMTRTSSATEMEIEISYASIWQNVWMMMEIAF